MRSRILGFALLTMIVYAGCKKSDPGPDPNPNPNPAPGCATLSGVSNGGFVRVGTQISLSWSPVSGASSYDVYLGTSANPTTTIATNVTSTSTNYTVPAAANTTYYWYVVPKSASGAATGCAASSFSFKAISISAPAPLGFHVVGYFPSYRALSDVPDIKFRMTNVACYAFFGVNSSGTLSVPSTGTQPAPFITKAHANGAKAMMSINDGSGDGKTNFKNMASTATGRNNFIKDVMNKVRQYGFDGVDVDWEFPSTSDGSDVTFTALMKELSDSLHRDAKYYLSAAITAGKYAGGIRDAIKAEIFPFVDFFNIMAYDDFSTTTPYRHHSDYNLAVLCLNYWKNTRGMPASKIVLGFPGYGRPSGITQSGTVLAYRDILTKGGSPLSDSAVVSNGSFTNYTIYYNGTPTVKKKAIFAKDNGNGVMIWEKWHDAHDANSLLKAACDTVGRVY